MKNIIFLFAILLTIAACTNESLKTSTNTTPSVDLNKYPPALQKVLAKHGGLETWSKMKAMSYEIVDSLGNEKQQIDLQNRRERIEAPDFKMGFNGNDFWLEADTSYKGNPVFYKNLMFYFYAMPFVVADEGVIYGKTEPLTFDGKSYPGIRISYEDGVGVSSKDEYFVHYDPATFEMAWLGYTVTYFSGEKSPKVKWIRYDDWKKVSGLVLPNSISWFKLEDNNPSEMRNEVKFTNIKVSETAFNDAVFAKTADAEIVKQ